ncbi:MAG: LLM class flavin-dependent oxidoreductase [Alphaproteobacteria bacterium]
MRLGFFTMPIHPLHRDYQTTLREDRETIILCDQLGFHDAFVGEHLADAAESISNSMIFLATLIHATQNIKLGTGTTNLAHNHPVLVATHAAMFDHLADGRFILGISPGTLRSDREAMDILEDDHNKIFADAIEVVLEIWKRDPPYQITIPGNRFKVTTETSFDPEFGVGVMPKPLQDPHPEIVGTVVAPFSKGVVEMGRRNFHPLSANFLLTKWLPSHWQNYQQGCDDAGIKADRRDWRIARTIFVADDETTASAYGKFDSNSPYRFYYNQLFTKLKRAGRHGVFKRYSEEPDDTLTLDRIVDDLVISGTVNSVVDQILSLRAEVGAFGELVVAGMDWVDETLTKRSLQLMADQVIPRVNEALKE